MLGFHYHVGFMEFHINKKLSEDKKKKKKRKGTTMSLLLTFYLKRGWRNIQICPRVTLQNDLRRQTKHCAYFGHKDLGECGKKGMPFYAIQSKYFSGCVREWVLSRNGVVNMYFSIHSRY